MNSKGIYDFNPDDWQGRRKDQVESSYKAVGWTFLLFVALFLIAKILGIK